MLEHSGIDRQLMDDRRCQMMRGDSGIDETLGVIISAQLIEKTLQYGVLTQLVINIYLILNIKISVEHLLVLPI